MKQSVLSVLLIMLLFSSCRVIGGKRVSGNGDVQSQQRSERNFQGVEVNGAIQVFVRQDSAYSVRVETDANLQEYVETYSSGDMLVIQPRDGINLRPSAAVKVYVTAPVLLHFDVSGASQVTGEGRLTASREMTIELSGASQAELDLKSPTVAVKVSGASDARLTGETKDLLIDGTGASKVKGYGLLCEKAEVDLSGASNAEVFASVELQADASGASDIRYKGNANLTRKSESGAGSIKKAE